MDGPTTLQEIRKLWGPIPVVLHTGHVDGPLLNRALECSPFTVLAKPCSMEQLIQTIRAFDKTPAAGLRPPALTEPCSLVVKNEKVEVDL